MKKIAGTVTVLGILTATALGGCAPAALAVGAGAGVGVAAAQEGGLRGAVNDRAIYLKISDLWLKKDMCMYRRLGLTVQEGRVLITGSVPTPDMRVDAVRLAWQAEGVRQVINEIHVDDGPGVASFVTDSAATGSIKTQMTFDKYIQSINYNVETVGGTVYLMGIAQDQKELDRVLDIARNTRYVKDVVSYVRLRGETPPGVLPPTDASASPPASGSPANAAPPAYSTSNMPTETYSGSGGIPSVEPPTELH